MTKDERIKELEAQLEAAHRQLRAAWQAMKIAEIKIMSMTEEVPDRSKHPHY